jgi:hypothetical protein
VSPYQIETTVTIEIASADDAPVKVRDARNAQKVVAGYCPVVHVPSGKPALRHVLPDDVGASIEIHVRRCV